MLTLLEELSDLLMITSDKDDILDWLQEFEPAELSVVCDQLWVLELVVSYCKATRRNGA